MMSSRATEAEAMVAYRALFTVLGAGWCCIRAFYAGRHSLTHRDMVERRSHAGDRILLVATFVSFVGAAALWLLRGSPAFAALEIPLMERLAGCVIASVGLFLFGWTHHSLGNNWSIGLEVRRAHSLTASGPYRLVRHPMYLAILLFEIGLGVLAADALLLVARPAALLLLVLARIPREERLMRDHFGASYSAYAAGTHRLIPWVY